MMMTRSSLCLFALLALPGSVVLAAVVSPRELPSLLRDAITTPAALARNEAVLDVAEPGMVVGARRALRQPEERRVGGLVAERRDQLVHAALGEDQHHLRPAQGPNVGPAGCTLPP